MSEILLIITIIVLSPQKIQLSIEKVHLAKKTTLASEQYVYENTQSGFQRLQADSEGLQTVDNLPTADCVFNLNTEAKGFLNAETVPASSLKEVKQPQKFSPGELIELCRKVKARF